MDKIVLLVNITIINVYWAFIFLVNPLCISDVELEFLDEVEAFGYSVIIKFHIQSGWIIHPQFEA